MKIKTKIYKKAKEFPEQKLPLLFSLPPSMAYDDSHDNITDCNVLIVQNEYGFTRVYSMGMTVLAKEDIRQLFKTSKRLL